ncbi:GNA1162 family protein [Thermodesulfatator atlanticus]|uniref:GNA1162 family protein n=1 Tax=Thermodesulfatator atlanticus TaxID=501497 RepID=UPI0003B5AFF5|nr:GNA1162 family protein [Thermodesulfatator atlanticus]
MFKNIRCLLLICLIFLVTSCGAPLVQKSYLRPGVDVSYIKKIAVLKFQNNSQNKYAAERLRNIVITEILAKGIFDVVDKSLVDMVLMEEIVGEEGAYNKATLRRIARKLGVQAVLTGSVDAYDIERTGTYSYPVVGLSLTLIDGSTGEIVWQASGTASGYSTWGRIFGTKGKDLTELSFELVQRLLDTLNI